MRCEPAPCAAAPRHRHRARGALRPGWGLSRVARGPRGGGAGRADAPRRRAAARARRGAAHARKYRRPGARCPARCGRARHADPGRNRHRQDRGAARAGDGARFASEAPGRARATRRALHVHQPPRPPNPRRRRPADCPGARSARVSGGHGRCAHRARPVHRPRSDRTRTRAARVPAPRPRGARARSARRIRDLRRGRGPRGVRARRLHRRRALRDRAQQRIGRHGVLGGRSAPRPPPTSCSPTTHSC